jgi:OFA family oxalate/formate antiporter-like MFS transporter
MAEGKVMNRWLVVVGALLIQVSLGAVYIYSVLKPGLKASFPTWSDTDLALPSQLVLACFALATIFAGRIQDKIGPKLVATVGGVMLGAGLFIASRADSLPMFILGFSVIGGLGIGTAYVCPIATCVKWFPDKRGLITGLAVAGFGAGGLVFAPIAKSLIVTSGVMTTLFYLGMIFLVAVVIGAQLMVVPPAGFVPEGWTPPAPAGGGTAPAKADYTWQEMLQTSQFWLMWVTYFAACTAGLMIIMNTANIWQSVSLLELVKGMPTILKADYAGVLTKATGAVMIVSVLNALGRIVWGKVSDSLGRKNTLLIMFLYCGIIMILLNTLTSYPMFIFGVASVGFCFGGYLALYPALTADFFGTKNVGVNYGWMFTAFGAGGLFGPWLAPKLMKVLQQIPYEAVDKTTGAVATKTFNAGSYGTSFIIAGIMCLASIALMYFLKAPSAKAK